MSRCLLLVALAFASCQRQTTPVVPATGGSTALPVRNADMDEFFVEWLKAHGHSDVVVDAAGVGVGKNATRLSASLFGSNQHEKGGAIVEVEFSVRLPSGGTITEFVAGMGETEAEAVKHAQMNFTLTTFHVVYKAFINADDPHLTATPITINDTPRELIAGDIMMLGAGTEEKRDVQPVRAEIERTLAESPLPGGPHWLKIVYSQDHGQCGTVSVTVDNADDLSLTEKIRRLPWPNTRQFYMAKQFLVIK